MGHPVAELSCISLILPFPVVCLLLGQPATLISFSSNTSILLYLVSLSYGLEKFFSDIVQDEVETHLLQFFIVGIYFSMLAELVAQIKPSV